MDAWDEPFAEPSEDERAARRVLALAIALINAKKPLSTMLIRRTFYEELTDAAFYKAFRRDQLKLAQAGLIVQRGPTVEDEATWTVSETSFAQENLISPEDSLLLNVLLSPLASNPQLPFARDLRLALSKIDHSFDGTSNIAIPPEARRRNKSLTSIEDCMASQLAVHVRYIKQDGTTTERDIAPYGLFYLNGNTYLVAVRLEKEHAEEEPHTYNLKRMKSVRPLRNVHYETPVDFMVQDYIRLPFQLGPTLYVATLQDSHGNTWFEDVYDEGMCAAWCIAEDVTPLHPSTLVNTYNTRIFKVATEVLHAT